MKSFARFDKRADKNMMDKIARTFFITSLIVFVLILLGCDEKESDRPAYVRPKISQMTSYLVKRAEHAARVGAYATALTICDRIDEEAPDYDYSYFLRGRILTNLERHEKAREAYEKVYSLNPDFPAIRFTLGNNAVDRRKSHNALDYFKEELKLIPPDDPVIKKQATLLQIGKVHKELGELDQAKAVLEQAIALDANHDEVNSELSQIYEEEGEIELALEAGLKALELKPESPDYQYFAGVLLYKAERPQEAITLLEKAKTARPWFHGVYFNLGRSLQVLGRLEEGEQYLSMVDSLQKRSSELGMARTDAEVHGGVKRWIDYGNMLVDDQRLDEALQAYQIALYTEPNDSAAKSAVDRVKKTMADK